MRDYASSKQELGATGRWTVTQWEEGQIWAIVGDTTFSGRWKVAKAAAGLLAAWQDETSHPFGMFTCSLASKATGIFKAFKQ